MLCGAVVHSAATPEPCCRYLQVTNPDPTDRIVAQSRALVRAIEALGTIEPSGPFERALACLLMAAYKRRLRAIVAVAPAWVSNDQPVVSWEPVGQVSCRPRCPT